MDREARMEVVVSAWRRRDPDGRVLDAPEFHDLTADDRQLAFEMTLEQRALEAALDPEGLTTTARAVLARIPR